MKVQIGSRRAYSFITDDPPEPGSKGYRDWEETDLIVFSWIVDNIENDIVADFAHHQTSKAIWDSLAVTFESKADLYLIYELEERASEIKQGDMDLETYYRKIHGMWIDVDRCQKKPIDCSDKGINQYRVLPISSDCSNFWSVEYDAIRREILNLEPIPSVETAYGWVKREAARRRIMLASPQPGAGVNGGIAGSSFGEIGFGLSAQNQHPNGRNRPRRTAAATYRPGHKPDKSKLWCSHGGRQKHTREECFLRVGYPEWWDEKEKARAQAKLVVGVDERGQSRQTIVGSRDSAAMQGKSRGITWKLHLVGAACVVSETSPRRRRRHDWRGGTAAAPLMEVLGLV